MLRAPRRHCRRGCGEKYFLDRPARGSPAMVAVSGRGCDVRTTRWRFAAALLAALVGPAAAHTAPVSDVTLLGAPFAAHAVLQRDAPIRIWGRAGAGEE